MPWVLNHSEGQQSYPAPAGETFFIVASVGNAALTVTRDAPSDASSILGTLAVYSYGGKLEAGSENLIVSPPVARPSKNIQTRIDDTPIEGFVLQAKTEARVETIILRHLDRISSGIKSLGGLTFEWKPPQIQVQSSEKKVEAAEAGDETEDDQDDGDLDNTVVSGVSKIQAMRSTPHLSLSHAEVIQETPTIDRVTDLGGLPSRTGHREMRKEPSTATAIVYSSASRGQSIADGLNLSQESAELGAFNTATQESHLPKTGTAKSKSTKRASPAVEIPGSASARSTKRIKVNDTDSVAASTQSARKTTTQKRQPISKTEEVPPRSQRSTPASIAGSVQGTPVELDGDYDGPKPRIALSNSFIQPNSAFIRFLKRQGGNLVDRVEGDCNILSIKEGPISKTAKLLQAVAHGLPIVTDKWLIDSTRTSRFLPLDPYKPPELEAVWKIPQDRLFKGYTIYFTPALKASYDKFAFSDVEKLCKAVGVRRVVSKKPGGKDLDEKTICLAEGRDDPSVPALVELGRVCYTKEFLMQSIVTGDVDLGGEDHRVEVEEEAVEEKPAKKRGRTRNG